MIGELGGTPETILFSQIGVSPARETIFWEIGAVWEKCSPLKLPHGGLGAAPGPIGPGDAPGLAPDDVTGIAPALDPGAPFRF